MSEKLDISTLASRRREEAIQRTNPTFLVESKSPQNVECKQIFRPGMGDGNSLQIDPGYVSRIRLAVGLLFLINALFNLFFGDPASLSTGRWSWVYRNVAATFGPISYPILQAVIGLAFIAWSRRKAQN
ncbi:MAG: hypothetical protein IV101_07070 [Dechloromonas sp.]|uniref:hypothetical protein n=1 Tax=Dechloromonas sp. TaxID=1917218 RepID=UPI0027F87ECE|nr:hypothetical protein [Dechloromonas sp.]MBT9520641.1 hypothetical protein [Dechloromonas sp.]